MAAYDAARHAELICDWSLQVQPGDAVLVQYPALAEALAQATARAILERGAWPSLRPEAPALSRLVVDHAQPAQLDAPSPIDLAEQRAATKLLRIHAPGADDPLAGADPARLAQLARGRTPLRRATLRTPWCLTITPTEGLARRAGMSTDDYASFVARALMLDRPDPAAGWAELSAVQQELCDRLARARTIHIEGPGTDLRLRVDGRRWQNSDGRRNLPSGEVFTGPRERSATGVATFDIPSYRAGGVVRGARLEFARGRVVKATAEEGETLLLGELDTDEGARYLGELGIGTSPGIDRATGSTLLDEKITGTVHLAVGQSYPETGGRNRSAVHWDLITDLRRGGQLTADGSTILRDGVLV